MRDEQNQTFCEHGGIWLLELCKFEASLIETEQQRWGKFFKAGETLNDEALPDWMNTREMKQAMNTLSMFSEKERQYFEYQARQEYWREQHCLEMERQEAEQRRYQAEQKRHEEELKRHEAVQAWHKAEQRRLVVEQELIQERQQQEAAKQAEMAALAEIERLKALLAKNEP